MRSAAGVGGFAEDEDADEEGSDCADAGPDGVSRPEGERTHGDGEEGETGDHRDEGDDGREGASEAVRLLHEEGPEDFENACECQQKPSHAALL